jgi:hypothetical protein
LSLPSISNSFVSNVVGFSILSMINGSVSARTYSSFFGGHLNESENDVGSIAVHYR